MKLTEDNFTLQWNPKTDESYIKIIGVDSMERHSVIKQIISQEQEIQQLKQMLAIWRG